MLAGASASLLRRSYESIPFDSGFLRKALGYFPMVSLEQTLTFRGVRMPIIQL